MSSSLSRNILFGVAIGDAIGVPVEFLSRKELSLHPVTDMIGYGTHQQPPGTWSDDSSLTFCLAQAMVDGYSIQAVAGNFVKWMDQSFWTAYDEVFDIGVGTSTAIVRLKDGVDPETAGGNGEQDNGNGSLMRILPLLLLLKNKPAYERFQMVQQVSSITHGHIRSVLSCYYYLEFARLLLTGKDKFEVYFILQQSIPEQLNSWRIDPEEIAHFNRLLKEEIWSLKEDAVSSSGYVVHTLEAAVWCLMKTDSYEDAVLKAVNLGRDTDTTGAVVGGLAGILYGYGSIPEHWMDQLARKEDIAELAEQLNLYYP